MKRRFITSPLVLLKGLFSVLFLVSCGKDGAEGPAGPAGPQGTPGFVSDSVYYSEWLDVAFKPDTMHTAGGTIDTIGYYAVINAPKLTPTLLGKADVKAYINSSDASDPAIYSLPYRANSGLYIDIVAYNQAIELYSNADLTSYVRNGKKYQQFRYMIVPGNAKARTATTTNWSNYTEVKQELGLKD